MQKKLNIDDAAVKRNGGMDWREFESKKLFEKLEPKKIREYQTD